ncbi:MAG: OmpH family outer membrane protein [Endomicrobium sp.]|nr:OmpH family outer membrane protein [Endomicrobium sp.]
MNLKIEKNCLPPAQAKNFIFFRKIPRFLPFFFFLFCFISQAQAIEIPVNKSAQSDKKNSGRIVFVDMEEVFNSHPLTQRYKDEIKNFASSRKNAIDAMVGEYESLKNQNQDIRLKISEAQKSENQETSEALLKESEAIEAKTAEKKAAIADLSQRTKREIILMEENNSLSVLKNIETVMQAVLQKYGGGIVFDKQSVLFEGDSGKDITEEVIKRIKDRQ